MENEYRCSSCGSVWPENYCPACMRTIDRSLLVEEAAVDADTAAPSRPAEIAWELSDAERGRPTRPTTKPKNLLASKWFWLIFGALLLAMPIEGYEPDHQYFGLRVVGYVSQKIGQALFLLLIAWLAWRLSRRSQLAMVASLGVLGGMSLIGSYATHPSYLRPPRTSTSESQAQGPTSAYRYSPPRSTVWVRFPSTPSIGEIHSTDLEAMFSVDGTRAELTGDHGIFRAEHFPMPAAVMKLLNHDELTAGADEYALQNGFDLADTEWKSSELGAEMWVRGTKVLHFEGEDQALTFLWRCILLEDAVFVVVVGGLSKDFPFRGAMDFIESVRRNG